MSESIYTYKSAEAYLVIMHQWQYAPEDYSGTVSRWLSGQYKEVWSQSLIEIMGSNLDDALWLCTDVGDYEGMGGWKGRNDCEIHIRSVRQLGCPAEIAPTDYMRGWISRTTPIFTYTYTPFDQGQNYQHSIERFVNVETDDRWHPVGIMGKQLSDLICMVETTGYTYIPVSILLRNAPTGERWLDMYFRTHGYTFLPTPYHFPLLDQ